MVKVVVTHPGERVVAEFDALVVQPTVPGMVTPPHIGLVEISQRQATELIPGPVGPQGPRGSRWTTGTGDPTVPGLVVGDMYLDDVSGDVWAWDGLAWVNTGTNIQGSPDTGADILVKLAPVDGAGSGLDADMVDGEHAASLHAWANLTGVPATLPPTLPIPQSGVTNLVSDLALKAPLASPAFTGGPTAPTPTAGDNDTSIATTAFVTGAINTFTTAQDTRDDAQDAAIALRLTDAPNDGLTYGRKNLAWATIVGGAVISDTPPPGPLQNGQLWWESDSGNTYIFVVDAGGGPGQWVQQNVTDIEAGITRIVETVITTSGTYIKPVGLKYLDVTVVGAGGGGTTNAATSAGNSSASGGGGGGGTARKLFAAASLPASVAYTVGVGGAGGNPAASGTSSTFSTLTGSGGNGGGGTLAQGTTLGLSSYGNGGAATGGDLNISGGQGSSGVRCAHGSVSCGIGGVGGGSALAPPRQTSPITTATVIGGPAGLFPGGGGCGSCAGASQSSVNGGDGGDGVIILREYF